MASTATRPNAMKMSGFALLPAAGGGVAGVGAGTGPAAAASPGTACGGSGGGNGGGSGGGCGGVVMVEENPCLL